MNITKPNSSTNQWFPAKLPLLLATTLVLGQVCLPQVALAEVILATNSREIDIDKHTDESLKQENSSYLSLARKNPETGAGQTGSSKAQSKEVQELAAKVLKALGGWENFKRFNDMPCRASGKIVQTSTISTGVNTFDCTMIVKRDKQWVSINFLGQPLITAFDGKVCWTKQGDTVILADRITAQRIAEDEKHGFLLLEKLGSPESKIELGKPKTINNHLCDSLIVWAQDNKPTTFYFDKENFLPIASSYQGVDLEQGVSVDKVYHYEDYRPIVDTIQPFKIIEFSGEKKVSETLLEKIEYDKTIDDSLFSMPTTKQGGETAQSPIKIPFEYNSNEILVKARLNNGPEMRFIVDTGATQSILDRTAAKNAGLELEETSSDLAMTTGAGHIKTGAAQIKKLSMGDLTLKNVPFALTDLTGFGQLQSQRPAGLIGANILKRYLFTVNYQENYILLEDPNHPSTISGGHIIDTKPSLGMSGLAVEGLIDGKQKATFLLDTGAAFNNISESKVKPLMWGPLYKVGMLKGLDGKPVATASARFNYLELGPLKIENPVFSIAETPSNSQNNNGIINSKDLGIIGNPLLSRYTATFDYRNQKLILRQSKSQEAKSQLEKELSLTKQEWLKTHNAETAARALKAIIQKARQEKLGSVEAMARAELAIMLCQMKGGDFSLAKLFSTMPQNLKQKSGQKLPDLEKLFADSEAELLTAYGLATKEQNQDLEGYVLAKWGFLYVTQCLNPDFLVNAKEAANKTNIIDYVTSAKQKISRAAVIAPNDADVLATSAYFLSRLENLKPVGKTPDKTQLPKQFSEAIAINRPSLSKEKPVANGKAGKKPASENKIENSTGFKSVWELSRYLVDQIIDQAIMIDPANWLALCTKMERCKSHGKADQVKILQGQMKHYHPAVNTNVLTK